MLISVKSLKMFWKLNPDYVIHIGAHLLEEKDAYEKYGWGNSEIFWIEGDATHAQVCNQMVQSDSRQKVVHAILSDSDGQVVQWHEATNGQSSGFLAPNLHLDEYPSVTFSEPKPVKTTKCFLRLTF